MSTNFCRQMQQISVVGVVAAVLTGAPLSAKTLRIGAQADAGTMDPHAQNIQTTISVLSMTYEALISRDRSLRKIPQLALSWENIEPTVWRFKLRPGVKFHDGAAFGADDVAASIQRAKAETSQFKSFVASIEQTRIVDDLTIDLVTGTPDAFVPDKLTYIFIMDKGWLEANNVSKPQDLTSQEEIYSVLNANGTGPYVLQSREPDAKTAFQANPDYWGETEGNIDEVVFQPIASDPTRMAALISGELDLVTDVPSQDVARLQANPALKLEQTNEFRTLFFGFDLASEALKYGDAGGKNPFRELAVRQAINQAIDADAIARTVMRGFATPTGQILAPGNIGYDESLDRRAAHDPEAAKQLLTDAGYPDGFAVTLDCPNNRYINDEQICRSVTTMLSKIGIDVTLNLMPRAKYFPKLWERDTSMFLMGFNSPYFDGMYLLETMIMSRNDDAGEGIYNYALYSNPELDGKIADARATVDPGERGEKMKAIYRVLTEDVVYVPLHHQVLVYAMQKHVNAPIRPDKWLEIRWVSMD